MSSARVLRRGKGQADTCEARTRSRWRTVHTTCDAGCVRPTLLGSPTGARRSCRSTFLSFASRQPRRGAGTSQFVSVVSPKASLVAGRAELAQCSRVWRVEALRLGLRIRAPAVSETRAAHSRAGSLRAPRLSDQAASLVGASGTSSPSPDAVLGSAARVGGSTAQWAQHSDLKKFEWTPARPVWSLVRNQRMLEMERRVTPIPPARPLHTTLTL